MFLIKISIIIISLLFLITVGIIQPIYILGSVFLILPLKTLYAKGSLTLLPKILIISPLIGLLAKSAMNRKKIVLSGLEVPIFILIILLLLRFIVSGEPLLELGIGWYLIAFWGLVFIMVNLLEDEKSFKVLLFFFLISAFLPSVAAYYQWLTGKSFLGGSAVYYHGVYRAAGTFTKVTGLSEFLQAYFTFNIAIYFLYKKNFLMNRLVYLLIILFNSFPLLLAVERSGVFGTMISLILIISKLKKTKRILIPILIATSIVAFVLTNPIWRLRIFGSPFNEPVSYQARINEIKILWHILYNYPIFGIGLSGYKSFVESYTGGGFVASVPHNIILLFVIIGGFWGVFLLAWLVIIIFRKYKNTLVRCRENEINEFYKSIAEASSVSLVGFSLTLITHSAIGADVLWILVGFLIASLNKLCR